MGFLTYNGDLSRVLVDVYGAVRVSLDDDFAGGDTSKWGAFNGSISSTQAVTGGPETWSMLFTSTASSSGAAAENTSPLATFPVTTGVRYRLRTWVKYVQGGTVQIGFDWRNGSTYVSTSTQNFTVAANTWTELTTTQEADPAANTGVRRIGFPAGVTSGQQVYIQQVRSWAAAAVKVQRSTDQLQWTEVRGASYLTVSPELLPVSDYEFTPDTLNYYRLLAAINVNPGFETDASGWSTVNGAEFAQSGAWSFSGSFSGLLTGDGTNANPAAYTEMEPVRTGDQLQFQPQLYSPQGWAACETGITWYDKNGTQLGSVVQDFPVNGAAETQPSAVSATVPSGTATQAAAYVKMLGTPATSIQLFTDEAALTGATASVYADSITPSIGTPWLKNVRLPFLNMPAVLSDAGDITRPSRSSTFAVIGRQNQVAVTLPRGGREYTVTIATITDDETAAVHALLETGDVILIQTPGDYLIPLTGYYSAGDSTETRQAVNWSRRWISVALTEVDAPATDIVGIQITWQGVVNAYPSWSALVAAQATWQDVLTLVGQPADVIVQ